MFEHLADSNNKKKATIDLTIRNLFVEISETKCLSQGAGKVTATIILTKATLEDEYFAKALETVAEKINELFPEKDK